MRLFTYEELENRVRRDLDLQDTDNFVQNEEMVSYFNEAIDDAESEIMKLNEDYFLTSATLSLSSGSANVDLPSDMYAQKIRSLIYSNGTKIYPVGRIRDPEMFYKKAVADYYNTSEAEYSYILKNATAGAQAKIVISPTPQESGAYLNCWYIRNANRIPILGETINAVVTTRSIQLATVIDVPEWSDYIVQFVKCRCYEKELDPRLPAAIATLAGRKEMMVATLTNRTPDNDDTVPQDVSFYEEHN